MYVSIQDAFSKLLHTSKVAAVLIFVHAMMSATNMQIFKNIARATKIKRYLFEYTFFWDTRYIYRIKM